MAGSEILQYPVSPRRGDTERLLLVKILNATNAGGGGGAGGVTAGTVDAGNGPPTSVPTTNGALYIQKDSVPPGQLWSFYDNQWH